MITTERIVVYNPGDDRAEVDVSVVPTTDEPAPPPQPFRLSVGPGGYEVVDYGDQDRIADGVPHATVVRSTNGEPVVAEQVTVDQGPVPTTRRSRREEPPARPTEVTATTGARLAAPVWRFPSLADPDDDESTVTFVVYNPDPTAAAEVRLDLVRTAAAAAADDEQAGSDDAVDPTAPVEVLPGARVAIELDADQAAGAQAAVVTADGPVVVDRVVRLGDGRRRAHGAGVPAAGGAVTLDRLAAAGPLGGLSAG